MAEYFDAADMIATFGLRDPKSLASMLGFSERATNATIAKNAALRGIGVFSNFGLAEITRSAAAGASADAALTLEAVGRSLSGSITRLRESRIKTLLTPVGNEAVAATVRRYKAEHSNERSGYRANDGRESGGKLLRALNSPAMFRVARDGISFVNVAHLDTAAKHWYRLNFGAGRKGKDTPAAKNYRMKFLGQDTGLVFNLNNAPSNRNLFMPPGLWGKLASGGNLSAAKPWGVGIRRGRGNDMFIWTGGRNATTWEDAVRQRTAPYLNFKKNFPGQSPLRDFVTPSRGMQGTRYLDAGVSRITDALPVAYTALINEWLGEAQNSGTGPFVTIAADKATLAAVGTKIAAETQRIMSNRRLKGFGKSYGF